MHASHFIRICNSYLPTGVWKAIEHERPAGNIKYNGWTFIASAISASTGNITAIS